jgi:hypothetical protein
MRTLWKGSLQGLVQQPPRFYDWVIYFTASQIAGTLSGAEHAVLHLLYSRFWHKVLYDLGLVNTVEPFQRLINQSMILGEDNQKMSKSRGNVINPDDIVRTYGADAMRVYEMFMGPLELSKPWILFSTGGPKMDRRAQHRQCHHGAGQTGKHRGKVGARYPAGTINLYSSIRIDSLLACAHDVPVILRRGTKRHG